MDRKDGRQWFLLLGSLGTILWVLFSIFNLLRLASLVFHEQASTKTLLWAALLVLDVLFIIGVVANWRATSGFMKRRVRAQSAARRFMCWFVAIPGLIVTFECGIVIAALFLFSGQGRSIDGDWEYDLAPASDSSVDMS